MPLQSLLNFRHIFLVASWVSFYKNTSNGDCEYAQCLLSSILVIKGMEEVPDLKAFPTAWQSALPEPSHKSDFGSVPIICVSQRIKKKKIVVVV